MEALTFAKNCALTTYWAVFTIYLWCVAISLWAVSLLPFLPSITLTWDTDLRPLVFSGTFEPLSDGPVEPSANSIVDHPVTNVSAVRLDPPPYEDVVTHRRQQQGCPRLSSYHHTDCLVHWSRPPRGCENNGSEQTSSDGESVSPSWRDGWNTLKRRLKPSRGKNDGKNASNQSTDGSKPRRKDDNVQSCGQKTPTLKGPREIRQTIHPSHVTWQWNQALAFVAHGPHWRISVYMYFRDLPLQQRQAGVPWNDHLLLPDSSETRVHRAEDTVCSRCALSWRRIYFYSSFDESGERGRDWTSEVVIRHRDAEWLVDHDFRDLVSAETVDV
jgi:hypothetical protein